MTEDTKKLASIIKNSKPDTIIIIGGGLATSAKILHEKCSVDYCVFGDGEKIICNFVKLVLNRELTEDNLIKCKGISFYNSKKEFIFTGYDSPPSADEISFPDYSILEKIGCLDHYIQPEPSWLQGFGIDHEKNDKKNAKLIKIMENRVLSLQSMAEGQPTRLQQIHDKDYFPNKGNKDGNYKALKIVTTLLPFGLLKKVNQYIKGVDFFKVHPVSAPAVDQFFNPRFAETAIK